MITTENKSINFIKKEELTGSYKGMRYRMRKNEEGFVATIWPEPLCFDQTSDELKESKDFPLTVEGRDEAVAWLNKRYEDRKSEWEQAAASFMKVFRKD